MELVRRGLDALRLHLDWVAIYVGVHVLVMLVLRGIYLQMPSENPLPVWVPAVRIIEEVGFVALISVLQAIIFARFGKELEKPLWKCGDDKEAVQRFFMIWFIWNLFWSLIVQFKIRAIKAEALDLAYFLELITLFGSMFFIPVGVAIMYWGRLEWKELWEALRPTRRHPEFLFPAMLLGFLGYMMRDVVLSLLLSMDVDLETSLTAPAIAITLPALIELLAFTVMWQACVYDRNNPPEDDDEFDF